MKTKLTEATKRLQYCRKHYPPDDPRTCAAFAARQEEVEAEETPKFGVWYLSFANETGFRGAVLVHAHSMLTAIRSAHDNGINPGGEVKAIVPNANTARIPEKWLDRLLSREDITELDREMEKSA